MNYEDDKLQSVSYFDIDQMNEAEKRDLCIGMKRKMID